MMSNADVRIEEGKALICLKGHIDSTNAKTVEDAIFGELEGRSVGSVTVDCTDLSYISSAGLRMVLKLKKQFSDLSLTELSPEVYDIFDMTGFTEMMDVRKRFRTLSVEGCEIIGSGVNGDVYRIDAETIVKIYKNDDALSDIENERSMARKAFVKGIPTAIPYDTVKVGKYYGSVFELLDAGSLAKILAADNSKLEWVTDLYTDLLKKIHSTEFAKGELPQIKYRVIDQAENLASYLPAETNEKIASMLREIPEDLHMVHGDYHLKNVLMQGGEAILIDMDTISCGNPIFDFAYMYNTCIGYGALMPGNTMEFLGIPQDVCTALFRGCLQRYFPGMTDNSYEDICSKASVIGHIRILRRFVRSTFTDEKEKERLISECIEKIVEGVRKVDRLYI